MIGGGGHAKVLIEALNCAGRVILGVLDPALPVAAKVLGAEVLGDDQWLSAAFPEAVELVNGLGSVPDQSQRRRDVFRRWKALGYSFATVIHPSAIVASDVVLGEGVQIMAGVVMQPGTVIGANTIVNTRVSVDHDCEIGLDCHLAPGVTLSGSVRVGNGAHVGSGATVIQGMVIGENAVIAAGATVYRDVPAGARFIPGKF